MPALGLIWIVLTLLAPTPVPQGMPAAARSVSNEQSASEAHAILDGAQRAVGVWPTPDDFQLLTAAAVEGPIGSFRTTLYSSADGRVRMEQPHSGFLAGVGQSGGWMMNPESSGVGELGQMESFVRGHEIHMLALLPRSRAGDPRFLGPHRFGDGDALAVALTLATGDSLVVYFQPTDTLPIGLRVPWMEPHVLTHWTGWTEVEGVRLFRQATFRQGPEEFRYTFDRLETGPFSEALFEAPAESALFRALGAVEKRVAANLDQADYEQALREIATLRGPVDAFFEDVLVMAEEDNIRRNRLALLNAISGLFGRFADFSKIST